MKFALSIYCTSRYLLVVVYHLYKVIKFINKLYMYVYINAFNFLPMRVRLKIGSHGSIGFCDIS